MNNNDFASAVNKFFFYANNYHCVEITYPTLSRGKVTEYQPEFFKAFRPGDVEHLICKFNAYYEDYGCRGAMNAFYGDLDGDNRMRLLSWVNENYDFADNYGINLKLAE